MKEVYIVRENDSINVPILNIRMMTDDEWNRLSYQNWLERRMNSCMVPV